MPKKLIGVCLAILLLGGCTKTKDKVQPPKTIHADFQIGEVRPIDPTERPDAKTKADAEAAQLKNLLDDLFDKAFVVPSDWKGGTHPGLAASFTPEAQAGLAANLGGLALTDLAASIDSVKPRKQFMTKTSVFFDPSGSATQALVTVEFEADAKTKPSAQGPVGLVETGMFWFTKAGGTYKISAYSTTFKADTVVKSAAFGEMGAIK
ncbi:MAG: hypothetical protein ABR507_12625 [Actinomycetota bacterium]|nr:hypothetical protein [Actinomycetota bacterium]